MLLAACGRGPGGGSDTNSAVSTSTFNIAAGIQKLVANGSTTRLNITGSCIGTYSLSIGPANVATTFETQPALSATELENISFTTCTSPSTITATSIYYNASYVLLGFSSVGSVYGVNVPTSAFPNSARVGDVAILGTVNLYPDQTKVLVSGVQQKTYVVEQDTASTAILNIISKTFKYDIPVVNGGILIPPPPTLSVTEQFRYRVAPDGGLTLIFIDIQEAGTTGKHLIIK